LNVLVIIQGQLGERLVGPEIRGWEIVRAFAGRHRVTAAADVPEPRIREGIRVVPRSRGRLLAEARRHDVVIAPLLPPYLLPALALTRCVRVADLYDPVDLEFDTLGESWRTRRLMRMQRALRRMQLRSADLVLSANQRQSDRTRADLASVPRADGGPVLLTVPMGLPEPPAPTDTHPLRDRFPQIGRADPVILWWGSVWRWLDAGTAILAVERLARERGDVRFVITAGKPADPGVSGFNAAEEARQLARERGLLDRHVFFLDEWVPYVERDRYIADADVGLTLHAAGPEAALAARARYMDYVWASLPSVLAHGDEVADQLAAAGAARLVPPRDAEAAAAALDALLSDRAALEAARAGCRAIAEDFRWARVLAPLVEQVEALAPAPRSSRRALELAGSACSFYANRVIDVCGGVK
jgi:glycosyltransferase involved in cell wall biosynthesis